MENLGYVGHCSELQRHPMDTQKDIHSQSVLREGPRCWKRARIRSEHPCDWRNPSFRALHAYLYRLHTLTVELAVLVFTSRAHEKLDSILLAKATQDGFSFAAPIWERMLTGVHDCSGLP